MMTRKSRTELDPRLSYANSSTVPRVLFIEPFYAGSHKTFADGLVSHSGHEIELLTLPGGEWRRRMRRGAQELAAKVREVEGEFEAIIATDMLDLSGFLALTRRRFARTPILYYLHENQFTYPRLKGTKLNSWFGQMNYLSAVVADRIAFNSEFHRADFLAALRTLAGMPNNWLLEEAIGDLEAKSSVLPVGLELSRLDASQRPRDGGPPIVLWNHRWEFDKEPALFARVVGQLAEEGVDLRVAVAGEPGENPAPELAEMEARLGPRVIQSGYVESREAYAELLWRSSIAVSTSRQEFFGIATVEAMYCGCLPIVPARLNYPALIPRELHPDCLWETEAELKALLRSAVERRATGGARVRNAASEFDWRHVAPAWDAAIAGLVRGA